MLEVGPRFLTVAVGAQVDHDPTFTDEVNRAAGVVAEAFAAFYGSVESIDPDATADRAKTEAWLTAWSDEPQPGEILYWIGHGRSDGDADYYLGLGTSAAFDHTDSLSHDYLSKALRRHQDARKAQGRDADDAGWLVLIVDACDAAVGVPLLSRSFPIADQPDNLLILSTNVHAGETFAGSFATKLAGKLKEISGNQASGVSINDLFLVRMAADVRHAGHLWSPRAVLVPRGVEPLAGTVEAIRTVEEYLAQADPALRNHFYAKARSTEQNEPGWYFVGRTEERTTIANWIDEAASGMLIITGAPASGKSALLGRVLLSLDNALENRLIGEGQLIDERHLRPHNGQIDTVLHLRGLRLEEVVRAICTAFDLTVDRPHLVAGQLAAKATSGPLTILADALDEAAAPSDVAGFLVDLANREGVRIIVGTRATSGDGEAVDLIAALSEAEPVTVVSLPPSTENDRRQYTRWRLDQVGLTQTSNHLVTEIARLSDSFLVIRIVLAEIAAHPALLDDVEAAGGLATGGLNKIYQHLVTRVSASRPAAALALESLAYAHGKGLPRDDLVWETAATTLGRVHHRPPTHQVSAVSDDDLSWVLDNLATHVLEDSEQGSAVYRLAHQTLADYLRRDAPPSFAAILDDALARALPRETPYRLHLPAGRERTQPDTLTSRNNLAYAYRSAGDLGRAIPLYEQTLTDRERVLGADHPDTLTSRNNLAYAYWQDGRLMEAHEAFARAASVAERLFGPEHEVTRALVANRNESRRVIADVDNPS